MDDYKNIQSTDYKKFKNGLVTYRKEGYLRFRDCFTALITALILLESLDFKIPHDIRVKTIAAKAGLTPTEASKAKHNLISVDALIELDDGCILNPNFALIEFEE